MIAVPRLLPLVMMVMSGRFVTIIDRPQRVASAETQHRNGNRLDWTVRSNAKHLVNSQ